MMSKFGLKTLNKHTFIFTSFIENHTYQYTLNTHTYIIMAQYTHIYIHVITALHVTTIWYMIFITVIVTQVA